MLIKPKYVKHVLSEEAVLVLQTSHLKLDNDKINQIKAACKNIKNWKYFTHLALKTYLAPIVYSNFKKLEIEDIPDKYLQQLKSYYLKVLSFNIILYEDFNKIATEANEKKLFLLALKGVYFAEYLYENIGLRQVSDIDILAKKEDNQAYRNMFEEMGWKCKEVLNLSSYHKRHFPSHAPYSFTNGKSKVDFHNDLFSHKFKFKTTNQYFLNAAKKVEINGNEVWVLNINHQFIFTCIHAFKHVFVGMFKASSFIDIALLVEKNRQQIDWEYIYRLAKKDGYLKPIQSVLFLLNNYFDVSTPAFFNKNESKNLNKYLEKRFLRALDNYKLKLIDYIYHYYNKGFHSTNFTLKKVIALWFEMFPSKSYLKKRDQNYYKGGYLVSVLRRFRRIIVRTYKATS